MSKQYIYPESTKTKIPLSLPRSLFGRTRKESTSSTTYDPASPLNKSSLDNGITKSTSIDYTCLG